MVWVVFFIASIGVIVAMMVVEGVLKGMMVVLVGVRMRLTMVVWLLSVRVSPQPTYTPQAHICSRQSLTPIHPASTSDHPDITQHIEQQNSHHNSLTHPPSQHSECQLIYHPQYHNIFLSLSVSPSTKHAQTRETDAQHKNSENHRPAILPSPPLPPPKIIPLLFQKFKTLLIFIF